MPKKMLHTTVAVLFLAAFFLSLTVTPARAASEVTFLGARYIVGKGLAITFKISADFDFSQLASVNVNGKPYDLACTSKGESQGYKTIVCIAKVSQRLASGEALISLGSYTFNARLVEPRPWCYSIFDYDLSFTWDEIGSHCQAHTAATGDLIYFYNPVYGDYFDYIYGEYTIFDPFCGPLPPNLGSGFYYEC